MKIEISDSKGIKVIALSGDIDMYSSPDLRKELLQLVHKRVSPLLVDFRGVSYIDSSGIATFVEGLKNMMTYGGKLRLIGIPEKIMEIFCFAKLDRVFEIYGTIDDARNH
jgi:anti-sigma B factor antagonist